MFFLKKFLISITSILLFVGLVFLALNQNKSSLVQPTKAQKVRIGYRDSLSGLPYHVAKSNNYFKSQAIEVVEQVMPTSNAAVESIVRGDIDVSVSTTLQATLPVEKLTPNKFKIFSHLAGNNILFDSIIVKKDSQYNRLQDLKDKKIGVLQGSTATNILKAYVKSQNIDLGSSEFVQIKTENQLQALEAGSIDGLLAYEPTLSIAMNTGKFKSITSTINFVDPEAPTGILIISQDFLNREPFLAKKVVDIFDQVAEFSTHNKSKVADVISQSYKLDQETANKIAYLNYTKNSSMNPSKVQEYTDYLFAIGELKEGANVADMFYRTE
jgi:NitT/TauT family transport system substrate-binding protein